MGHIRTGVLPKSRKWKQVISLLNSKESSTEEIAAETVKAAKDFFYEKKTDSSLIFSYWLLTQITYRAKEDNYISALEKISLDISKVKNSFDFLAKVADYIRNEIKKRGESFPLSEFAQLSLREVLTEYIGQQSESLFGTTLEDIRLACRKYSSPRQFSKIARLYFAKVFSHGLIFILSKEAPNSVGINSKFEDVSNLSDFNSVLEAYCYQSSKIVEKFAEGWYSKKNWEGDIQELDVKGFVAVAVEKFRDELAREHKEQ